LSSLPAFATLSPMQRMKPHLKFSRWPALGAAILLLLAGCVRVPVGPVPAPPHPRPTPSLPPHPRTPQPETPVTAAPQTPVDVLFAVQTHLNRDNFSTGGLDGHWGRKSEKALAAWQKANHLPSTGQLDDAVLARLGRTNNLLTTYTVTRADHASLTEHPASWLTRSQMERMGHVTIEERVAEKFHLYRSTLRRMNPQAPWPNPPAGVMLTVPSVKSPALPPLSKLEIRLGKKTLRAYDNDGELVAQFPCSIAANKAKRPEGETLRVVVWAENPDYTFDPDLFAENPEAAAIGKRLRIPPGPNNPVGVAWIGLDRPGYGIHGTPSPEDISNTESHGCFRLTNWDAYKLVRAVRTDLPVLILP